MASESTRPTPLGVARARFVDGLPRKASELRGSVALLAAAPGEEKPREDLRRRLHALYASAQVFQIAPLSAALKDAIARLDRAKDSKSALSDADIEALAILASTLPVLGQAEPSGPPLAASIDELPPQSTSDFAIPVAGMPEVHVPPAAKVPSAGPRASAPPGGVRNTLPMNAPAPASSSEPAARPRPQGRSDTLRGLPKAESQPPPAIVGPPLFGRRVVETVISVLVIDAAEWQAKVRATLPAERFEVLGASDPEEALRLARSSAPDVVMLDHAILLRSGPAIVRRLRDDPLTDFVPVVALVASGTTIDPIAIQELGAEEALTKPFEAGDLAETLERLVGGQVGRGALAGLAGEHTLEEVATRIADEVRRGLVEAADRGRDLKVPLGDGTEVLAAAWSVIGRLRAHVAQRSGGRVHFHDTAAPGGPSFLALTDDEEDGAEAATTPGLRAAPVSLRDRHIVVADDDPAVVWFFAGLLREEGAIVEEAGDGQEVLERARKKRPDLVISDILMPRLDGFALTRELKRDPALSDVPVILLSWKEDFLQRMRELQSGASGYLRKEAGAGQILECVRETLRPRARLEAQLRAGGDVRGRLERTGILPLITTVAQHRPSARITVRDAWNLFEIDLRPDGSGKGQIVDLTRTASDGSFSRGPRVVVPLLGATAGRFSVVDADTPMRASIKEPLDVVLRRGAAQIGALVDAVSGKGLALAASVTLDDEVVGSLLRSSPEPMSSVIEALRAGRGPRQLILDGAFAPDELESVLLDLARQGAITAVSGIDGEDRIASAISARGEIFIPLRTPSLAPPALDEKGSGLTETVSEGRASERSAEAEPSREGAALASRRVLDLDAPEHDPAPKADVRGLPVGGEPDALRALQGEPPPDRADAVGRAGEGESSQRDRSSEPLAALGASEPAAAAAPRRPSEAPGPMQRPSEAPPTSEAAARSASEALGPPVQRQSEAPAIARPASEPPFNPTRPIEPSERESPRSGGLASERDRAPRGKPSESEHLPARAGREAVAGRPQAMPDGDRGIGALGWSFLAILLVVVGFVGYRTFVQAPSDPLPTALEEPAAPAEMTFHPDELDAGRETASADPTPPSPATLSGYGRIEPGIADRYGVAVEEGAGLVVLEPSPAGEQRVRIADREHLVGADPVALAMPEGIHEVAFVQGDDLSFRFVRVQAGYTRYVPAPPPR